MKYKFTLLLLCFAFITGAFFSCTEEETDAVNPVVQALPSVTTGTISAINNVSASAGGEVTAAGGSAVIARGVCWSTIPNPNINTGSKTTETGTTGSFISTMTGLTPNTTYFVRAYATNSAGTAYGYQLNFTTTDSPVPVDLAEVTTAAITAIQQTTATGGGNVESDGGLAVTARGICWSTSPEPTTANNKTTQTGTTGAFVSNMTGLTAGTMYYVRAYATTSAGTAYGNQVSFTTTANTSLPAVTTAAVTEVTQTTATGGGNVTSDGGQAITARGICWATTAGPTTANNKTTQTGTTGAFTSAMTGLSANTQYYVRAYATTSAGTAYGNEVSFTTAAPSTGGPVGGNAICNGTQQTVVVPITSSTGKVWMDRNLGASRAATNIKDFQAYGCLYQWGRGNDGHASITWVLGEDDDWGNQAGTAVNGVTYTQSNSDTPPNALFIADQTSMPYDWRSPKNDNLWQGVNGINNPCPAGYRVPTRPEYQAEISAYSMNGTTSAYNSVHKFPMAGDRAFDSGNVRGQGEDTQLWTSTVSSGNSHRIIFQPGAVYTNDVGRAGGYSVRCIKN